MNQITAHKARRRELEVLWWGFMQAAFTLHGLHDGKRKDVGLYAFDGQVEVFFHTMRRKFHEDARMVLGLDRDLRAKDFIPSSILQGATALLGGNQGAASEPVDFAQEEEFRKSPLRKELFRVLDVITILDEAFVVAVFSLFENRLKWICDFIPSHIESDLEIRCGDLQGRGLTQMQVYLEKVLKLKFPVNSPEWDDAKMLQLIRNLIVHNSGIPRNPGEHKTIATYSAAHPELLSLVGNHVAVLGPYRKWILARLERFLVLLRDGNKTRLLELKRRFFHQGNRTNGTAYA